MRIRIYPIALLLLVFALAGCATPVGVDRVSPKESYQDAFANPLSDQVASDETRVVMNRFNLTEKFRDNPAEALAALHEKALTDKRRDILFALSEMAYLFGDQLSKSTDWNVIEHSPDYFLLSAVYASQYILGEGAGARTNDFDSRIRSASNLYNFSLWRGLSTFNTGMLVLEPQVRKLPIGNLTISLNLNNFPFRLEDFETIEPADKFAVRGMSTRNRSPGMGLPLIGIRKAPPGSAQGGATVPMTLFMRLDGGLDRFKAGDARASLEFYATVNQREIEVNGKRIPLETDTTTPLAYRLEGAEIWDFGVSAFLGEKFGGIPNGLFQLGPYQPGRIPVVLVHGTASSPVWWADMFNTLGADETIRNKFQFWFFIYKSKNMVTVSAADLRDAINQRVASLDPEGKDPALKQIVVIGHSQGGLLTKLTAVDAGEELVRALTGKGLEEIKASDETKAMLNRVLLVKPVPSVKRVVFISTPHRGSYLSTNFVRNLVSKLVTLPRTIMNQVTEIGGLFSDDVKAQLKGRVPSSIDGMSPDNPLLKALVEIPLAPGIHGHSIIAINDDSVPPEGADGVVKYTSAHLDGMDSEFIVRSGHSCQGHPFTIEEVRRILLVHLESQQAK